MNFYSLVEANNSTDEKNPDFVNYENFDSDLLNVTISKEDFFKVVINYNSNLLKENLNLSEQNNKVLSIGLYIDNELIINQELNIDTSEFIEEVPLSFIRDGKHQLKVNIIHEKNVVTSKIIGFEIDFSPTVSELKSNNLAALNEEITIRYIKAIEGIYGWLEIYFDNTLLHYDKILNNSGIVKLKLNDLLLDPSRLTYGNHVVTIKAVGINNSTIIYHHDILVDFKPTITPAYSSSNELVSVTSSLETTSENQFISMQLYCGQFLFWSSDSKSVSITVSRDELEQKIKGLPNTDECVENGFLAGAYTSNGSEYWKVIKINKQSDK